MPLLDSMTLVAKDASRPSLSQEYVNFFAGRPEGSAGHGEPAHFAMDASITVLGWRPGVGLAAFNPSWPK